jgi:hypothetical protein
MYCELTLAFHVFTEHFSTNALCAIDNYECAPTGGHDISKRSHVTGYPDPFFQLMNVIYYIKVVH